MTETATRALKSTIRQQIRQHLAFVDDDSAQSEGAAAARRLIRVLPPGSGALFCAWNGEIDLRQLHELYAGALAYPRCLPSRQLQFHWSTARPTDPGPLGIPAPAASSPKAPPSELAFVLVPGAAFDRLGNRLGWGAGYYDRFLATLPRRTLRIGVAHDWQVIDYVPSESHDIPMHFILTPNTLLDCRPHRSHTEPEARLETP